MATSPSFFRCPYEMPSGPTEEKVLSVLCLFRHVGGGRRTRVALWLCLRCVLSILLSEVSCGSLKMDAKC